jgi:histidyl-tRNA synthetase
METLDCLLGKYGEEGDRLIFKVLNSGDFSGTIPTDLLSGLVNDRQTSPIVSKALATLISEKALRYDLTVPFARFVVQHREEISFPFKRYQIQPVWRADRPQKGRYREFYQCDVDVIGSNSLLNETELICIIDQVFNRLGINIQIKLNNRKILAGLAEVCGFGESLTDFTITLDKLDKIGIEAVQNEWSTKGISGESIDALLPVIGENGDNLKKINILREFLRSSETGSKGIEETETLLNLVHTSDIKAITELDLTLARGLNYYTGAIIEVKTTDTSIGSICGGGRYDNLTGIFGMAGVSGVGVSFGADRIYDVLEAIDGFPKMAASGKQVLFLNFGAKEATISLTLAQETRNLGIRCELFPDAVKIKKQLQYADQNKIPVVIMIGEEENKTGQAIVRTMATGEQIHVPFDKLAEHIGNCF